LTLGIAFVWGLRRGGLRNVGCGEASCDARVKGRSCWKGSLPEGEKVSVGKNGGRRSRESLRVLDILGRLNDTGITFVLVGGWKLQQQVRPTLV
jgi:hypothetical protein